MAIRIRFDSAGTPLPCRMILATKSGAMIRELPIRHVQFHETLMSGSEFSFTVYKNECVGADGEIDETFWDGISDFRLGYCPEVELWYELTMDVTESSETSKAVQAISLGEAELGQINVYGIEVNTESDIARDDYVPTVLYNASNPDASLINRLLYKAPHYRVEHVDASIAGMQRTFQFDGKSVYDAFQEVATEIDCLFKIECRKTDNDVIDRAISVYDLENTCQNCGNRGEFLTVCDKCGSTTIRKGYGEDTSIYIARENLAQEVNYSTNTDEVKNCFRLEGGDDLMTSTIINCNPNGSQYIWYLTDAMKADMSAALRNRLNSYDALYNRYQNTETYSPPWLLRMSYNSLVTKYRRYKPELEQIPETITGFPALMTAYYNTIDLQLFLESVLMPSVDISSTTAAEQAAKLTQTALSPCAVANLSACTNTTAGNAVLGMAKCLVRGSYQVRVSNSSYNSSTHIWGGNFTVTNYSDETDTAQSAYISVTINEDTETYINQKLTALLYRESDDATDISALFQLEGSEFSNELKKYCLNRLSAFRDACQAAMDILIQQGVADQASWAGESTDLYTEMYIPYRNKMAAIESEIALRESEIVTVVGKYDDKGGLLKSGMQPELLNRRNTVQNALDFESYLGTTLWKEFASYRRESTFENQNYISDGLNNEELFARAELFLNVARVEIYKSAMLQHTISATMNNLLSMQEFQPLRNKFAVGNWIRVRADGDVYRLRLSEYTVDYDSWNIDVVFTDVREGYDSASDIQSLLGAVRSMQTTYGNVARQASNGNDTMEIMNRWADVGFELTTKIVGNAQNQEFVMDESGLTGRELVPETGEYQKGQIKIISSGVYVTNDGWLTAKAGLGKFRFWDPQDRQEKDGFGVIADQLVGNMVLAGAVGVFNKSGSVRLDERGFTLTTNGSSNTSVFTIRKHSGSSYSNILSLDSTGNLVLGGGNIKGSISAALLTIGTIRDQANTNYWNLETGEFRLSASATAGGSPIATQATIDTTVSNTIVSTDVEYGTSDSDITYPTEWVTDADCWVKGKYLWTRIKMTTKGGSTTYSAPSIIAGINGLGVSKVEEQYYLSTSNTTQSGGSWSTTQQTWTSGRYYWTRSKITWSDGSVSYTSAVLARALTSGNQSTNNLDAALNQEGVFNRLTNNGALQGIYMSGGQLYINATYIKTGTLSANFIKGGTLELGKSSNTGGILKIYDASNAVVVQGDNSGLKINKGTISGPSITLGGASNGNGRLYLKNASDTNIITMSNSGMYVYNASGTEVVRLTPANGITVSKGSITGSSITIGGNNNANGELLVKNASGTTIVKLDKDGMLVNNSSGTKVVTANADGLKVYDSSGTAVVTANTNGLTVTKGTISGPNITGGTIGGWTINSTSIYSTTGSGSATKIIGLYKSGYYSGAAEFYSGPNNSSSGNIVSVKSGAIYFNYTPNGSTYYGQAKIEAFATDRETLITFWSNIGETHYVGNHGVLETGYDPYWGENYLLVNGNFEVAGGTKNRVVNTDSYSSRLYYSYETASPMFGDIGDASTDDSGECVVEIDDIFFESTRTDYQYQVFLQKNGSGDLWVDERTARYFIVRGTPNLRFSWEIKARQTGFESERLELRNHERGRLGQVDDSIYDNELNDYIIEQENALYETA